MMHQTFDGHRDSQIALPHPAGEELKTKYPDLQAVVMCDWGGKHSLMAGQKKINRTGHFIGEDAVSMFSILEKR